MEPRATPQREPRRFEYEYEYRCAEYEYDPAPTRWGAPSYSYSYSYSRRKATGATLQKCPAASTTSDRKTLSLPDRLSRGE